MTSDLHDFRHSSESVEHLTPRDVIEAELDVFGAIELDPASSAKANEIVGAKRIYTMADNGFSQPWKAATVHLNPPGGKCDVDGRPVFVATKKRLSCLETGACGLAPGRREEGTLIAGHNHVGVTSSAKAWWFRLSAAFRAGDVAAAIFVAFNLDIFQTTQVKVPLDQRGATLSLPLDFDFCVPSVRLEYLSENEEGEIVPGESPTHASAIILVSHDSEIRASFRACFESFGRVVTP